MITSNKIFKTILFIVIPIIAIGGTVYAINAWNEGWKIESSSSQIINYNSNKKVEVTNNNSYSIFVPTKTNDEKISFCNNAPNAECCDAINGGWSSWGAYGSCSKACGGGTKTRYRTCNSPSPQCGGSTCAGSNSQSISCNNRPCCIPRTCAALGCGIHNNGCGGKINCGICTCSYYYKDWCIGVGKLKWERRYPNCTIKTGTESCSGCTGSSADIGCGEDG